MVGAGMTTARTPVKLVTQPKCSMLSRSKLLNLLWSGTDEGLRGEDCRSSHLTVTTIRGKRNLEIINASKRKRLQINVMRIDNRPS